MKITRTVSSFVVCCRCSDFLLVVFFGCCVFLLLFVVVVLFVCFGFFGGVVVFWWWRSFWSMTFWLSKWNFKKPITVLSDALFACLLAFVLRTYSSTALQWMLTVQTFYWDLFLTCPRNNYMFLKNLLLILPALFKVWHWENAPCKFIQRYNTSKA